MPRSLVEKILSNTKIDPILRAYFRSVYYSKSDMIIFGANGIDTVEAVEGFRQGDAVSSLIYCLGIDVIMQDIIDQCSTFTDAARNCAPIHIIDLKLYMDDTNIVLECAKDVAAVATIATAAFAKYGMKLNMSKSSVTIPPHGEMWSNTHISDSLKSLGISYGNDHVPFVVLGADISENPTAFYERYMKKTRAFFDLLRGLEIHPSILFVFCVCSFCLPSYVSVVTHVYHSYVPRCPSPRNC